MGSERKLRPFFAFSALMLHFQLQKVGIETPTFLIL
jgi:hypothetical protein